jgi:hypothetical protein
MQVTMNDEAPQRRPPLHRLCAAEPRIQKKSLSVLRDCYHRGEPSNDEFDRRLEWTPGLGLPLE